MAASFVLTGTTALSLSVNSVEDGPVVKSEMRFAKIETTKVKQVKLMFR